MTDMSWLSYQRLKLRVFFKSIRAQVRWVLANLSI